MDVGIATQLITAGATLAGVVLTLAASASLERRRARDARELESVRLESDHGRWLRDERVKAYAGFALAGEDMLQFVRTDLPALIGIDDAARRDATHTRWTELRTDLRKAYNQVALFGTENARAAAREAWRAARNGGNDFLVSAGTSAANNGELSGNLASLASGLGSLGERFLEVCRRELQSGKLPDPSRSCVRKA